MQREKLRADTEARLLASYLIKKNTEQEYTFDFDYWIYLLNLFILLTL